MTPDARPVDSPSPPPPALPAIYVGFADNFSQPGSFDPFPDPWLGDPGVVFLGCVSDCFAYSAGAIRIDNPTDSPS